MKLSYGSWFDAHGLWDSSGWLIRMGRVISRGRGWCYDHACHLGAGSGDNEPSSFSDYRGFRPSRKVE
jgi:hypothetical protein